MFAKNTDKEYRKEDKYLVSLAEMAIIQSKLKGLCCLDTNSKNGCYEVRSLYLDNYENKCYFENENGVEPRRKYRFRIYNNENKVVSLEIKQKEHEKILKRRTLIDFKQAKEMIDGKCINKITDNSIINEFGQIIKTQLYLPVVIVNYFRLAYTHKLSNIRITFDTNISSSNNINMFFSKNINKRPIMPIGLNIMEVKYNEFLPDFILNTLNIGNLKKITFSKYYLCRKYSL